MARKRMLSPSIWVDPAFNRLAVPSRLIFIGLISNSDDYGYVRADLDFIKRNIIGIDSKSNQVKRWLSQVREMRSVHYYENNGEEYIHLAKWNEYQKQQKDRMLASEYPPCSICLATATQLLKEVVEVSRGSKKEGKQPVFNKELGTIIE